MKKKNTEQFQILSEIDHILKRPGMYVGSNSVEEVSGYFDGEWKTLKIVPALIKIINEIIDNSVDEYVRTKHKWANKIDIKIWQEDGKSSVAVKDNGRGIPVKKVDGVYQPVLAWTRARAGSNFGDDDERETIGMNGVGAVCTNVFSTRFRGATSDGKNLLILDCHSNGKSHQHRVTPNTERFTEVQFCPDFSLFHGLESIDEDHTMFIKERLVNLAATYPTLTFTLNGKRIKHNSYANYLDRFGTDRVMETTNHGCVGIFPCEEFRIHSYVNGLHIKNGGTHIDIVMNELVDHIRPAIEKKHKLDILPNQIKQSFLLVSILREVKNLKFDSQTKERITNPRGELTNYLNFNFEALAKQILKTPELIDPVIQDALAKKEAAERLALARKQKKMAKVRIPKHVEAQSKDPEKKILFISEGDSAAGRLASVRNSQTVQTAGGYPLRGKVMNTFGMKPNDIVKNKELSELMSVIGLSLGQKATSLNYGHIAIMTDMDTDGDAIACLLVNFFRNWPELFEQGRIYRVLSPLIIATKGKQRKTFYTKVDADKARLTGWEVQYIKGLGSLDIDSYREMIQEPQLIRIRLDDSEKLDMAFGHDSEGRKKWLL